MKREKKEVFLTECEPYHPPKQDSQKPLKPSGNGHAVKKIAIARKTDLPLLKIEFWSADKWGFFTRKTFPNGLSVVQSQAHGY